MSNLFLVKKKDWGQRPVINLKQHIPHCHFKMQNGRFAKSKIRIAKRRLHVQTILKTCIFSSSLGKRFKAICLLPLVRKLVRIPLPLLWFGISTTNIHKLVKFVMNWKKFVLTSVLEIEFLGLTITSVTLKLFLNKKESQNVISECKNLLNNPKTSTQGLTRLIGVNY